MFHIWTLSTAVKAKAFALIRGWPHF